jgi:hypothetical protein
MAYIFFGAFSDLHSGLQEEFRHHWPDADIIEISKPFRGLAVRFSQEIWHCDDDPDMLEAVTSAAREISLNHLGARIVLLRTECFGGDCQYWGQCICNGRVVMNEPYNDEPERNGVLRRLISNFGVDIGEREIFEPLSRAFPWNASDC